jgi:membrane protein
MVEQLKNFGRILLVTVDSFIKDNCFQYSASTAFYTLFSLAPIVVISVYVAGIFFGSESALAELRGFLNSNLGEESTRGVMALAETIQTNTENRFFLMISIFFLMVSSTSILIQLQYSFNQIFRVKAHPEAAVVKVFRDRVLAFGMILLLGAAMIFSLVLDSIMTAVMNIIPVGALADQVLFIGIAGSLFSLLMVMLAVMAMFHLLPDVKVPIKALLWGSLITALLLFLGKFLVGIVIGNSSLTQLTGASSSIIILMLWVYYSGIIIFFGIELVGTLAKFTEGKIETGKYARKVKIVEIETED